MLEIVDIDNSNSNYINVPCKKYNFARAVQKLNDVGCAVQYIYYVSNIYIIAHHFARWFSDNSFARSGDLR